MCGDTVECQLRKGLVVVGNASARIFFEVGVFLNE